MSAKEKSRLEKCFMIAWGLWRRTNKKIYKDLIESSRIVIERAPSLKQALFAKCTKTTAQELDKVRRWQPPHTGSFKLNVDGALFYDLQEAGIGVIVHDSKG